jgi:hypothetical protein
MVWAFSSQSPFAGMARRGDYELGRIGMKRVPVCRASRILRMVVALSFGGCSSPSGGRVNICDGTLDRGGRGRAPPSVEDCSSCWDSRRDLLEHENE